MYTIAVINFYYRSIFMIVLLVDVHVPCDNPSFSTFMDMVFNHAVTCMLI